MTLRMVAAARGGGVNDVETGAEDRSATLTAD